MRTPPLMAFLLLLSAGPLLAGGVKPEDPSLFQRVVPKPTGQNGYEEFVLAAQTLARSRHAPDLSRADLTLAEKRRVLADREVMRALALVQQGLRKPVGSPREKVDFSTSLPELSEFRRLARLLAMRIYVLFADGRTGEALARAEEGMRFARAVQTDTLVSGLVGIACHSIVVGALGNHLEQLSEKDCGRLFQIATTHLQLPDLHEQALLAERANVRRSLQAMKERIRREGADAAIRELGLAEQAGAAARSLIPEADPAALDRLFAELDEQLERHYLELFAEMRRPLHARRSIPLPDGNGTTDVIARNLLPALERVGEAYGGLTARLRLLACHAAIRKATWDRGRPPATLAELDLGEPAVDPFTGAPFLYEVTGRRFRLQSAGPKAGEEDPLQVEGRRPITISPD